MMRLRSASAVLFLVLAGFGAQSALAQTFTTLYTFSGNPGTDGGEPIAQLVPDSAGNLYGTTFEGGGSCRRDHFGCGTVFKLDTANNETVLLGFPSTGKGDMPETLIRDTAGNLYGITYVGGGKNLGTVFKLGTDGKEKVLHNFQGQPLDGDHPTGTLLRDSAGNIYGTTGGGGTHNSGTIFKLHNGVPTVLYNFTGKGDGAIPNGLVRDAAGNLYGTTFVGGNGCSSPGCGIVFKLELDGGFKVLHSFTGTDGSNPFYFGGGLLRDKAGNLYGATEQGGLNSCSGGCGVIFELTTSGVFSVLHKFSGPDGASPNQGLVRDAAGNLYGTAVGGGANNTCNGGGCGVIFKLDKAGKLTVLHIFSGADGSFPEAGLLRDSSGSLYGTTVSGPGTGCGSGSGCGTVFKLTP
jgi:uncharacterized repeat protein (TIGR03803 family)